MDSNHRFWTSLKMFVAPVNAGREKLQKKDEFLYVFVHIPKTAGTTFVRNVWYKFGYSSTLLISRQPNRIFLQREDVDNYIGSLSPKRRDGIRFIFGHNTYYGIHKHFQREPRYFTFLRDPVARTISNFNFNIQNYDFFLQEFGEGMPQEKDDFSFDMWWDRFQRNLQVGTILNYEIDNRRGEDPELRLDHSHVEQAKKILEKFFFVGLTETFEEDSTFLYKKMNVHRLIRSRQNVAKEKFVDVNDDLIQRILPDLALDVELYEYGAKLGREVKNNCPDFRSIVENFEFETTSVIPVRFIMMDVAQSVLGSRRLVALVGWVVRAIKAIIKYTPWRRTSA